MNVNLSQLSCFWITLALKTKFSTAHLLWASCQLLGWIIYVTIFWINLPVILTAMEILTNFINRLIYGKFIGRESAM